MDAKQAAKLIIEDLKDRDIVSCYEFDKMFVFATKPKGHKISGIKDMVMDSTYSVNKQTGEIKVFQPFHITFAEYRRGKKVTDFM